MLSSRSSTISKRKRKIPAHETPIGDQTSPLQRQQQQTIGKVLNWPVDTAHHPTASKSGSAQPSTNPILVMSSDCAPRCISGSALLATTSTSTSTPKQDTVEDCVSKLRGCCDCQAKLDEQVKMTKFWEAKSQEFKVIANALAGRINSWKKVSPRVLRSVEIQCGEELVSNTSSEISSSDQTPSPEPPVTPSPKPLLALRVKCNSKPLRASGNPDEVEMVDLTQEPEEEKEQPEQGKEQPEQWKEQPEQRKEQLEQGKEQPEQRKEQLEQGKEQPEQRKEQLEQRKEQLEQGKEQVEQPEDEEEQGKEKMVEEKKEMLRKLMAMSGMREGWAYKCLQQFNWDLDHAFLTFKKLMSENMIPPIAF